MGANNYAEWQLVAEQFSTQMQWCSDHLSVWVKHMGATDTSGGTKAFERAVMALEMAQSEMAKAAKMFYDEQLHEHVHVEAFNVHEESSSGHTHAPDDDSEQHPHPHSHVHA
ncbi:hypothetical protein BXT84_13720 [Sulfobacillus thermotolerans]|uniref:Cytosolic protein n=1 Tax=Sulfobacillus thermotolerans TaxID=338644 RepID=A0ABM6RVS5_9FIRM|nr:hypothetical protein BXT84_13720 [Sulfobacillus thermotolerans]